MDLLDEGERTKEYVDECSIAVLGALLSQGVEPQEAMKATWGIVGGMLASRDKVYEIRAKRDLNDEQQAKQVLEEAQEKTTEGEGSQGEIEASTGQESDPSADQGAEENE